MGRAAGLGVTLVLSAALAAPAFAEPTLYGVRTNGDVVWVDRTTGSAALAVPGGIPPSAAMSATLSEFGQSPTYHDAVVIAGDGPHLDELVTIDLRTGGVAGTVSVSGRPPGYRVRGLARASAVYALLAPDPPGPPELLAMVSTAGAMTVVGSIGRSDLETLGSNGVSLYALGTQGDGQLFVIDITTAGATLVGGGGYGGDTRALAVFPDGTAVAGGVNLRSVNLSTGAATLIAPLEGGVVQSLVVGENRCYPNCASGAFPTLNVQDFSCFLAYFAQGLPYANCDHSASTPVLNVADFTCFLREYSRAESCP